jgi:hypothetical protein
MSEGRGALAKGGCLPERSASGSAPQSSTRLGSGVWVKTWKAYSTKKTEGASEWVAATEETTRHAVMCHPAHTNGAKSVFRGYAPLCHRTVTPSTVVRNICTLHINPDSQISPLGRMAHKYLPVPVSLRHPY